MLICKDGFFIDLGWHIALLRNMKIFLFSKIWVFWQDKTTMSQMFQTPSMTLDMQNNLMILNYLLTKYSYKTRVFFYLKL